MHRIVLDVETAGSFGSSLVYDLGFIICDGDNPIAEYSWVISDVFYGMPSKMDTAYYKDKLPQYYKDIAKGTRQVISMREAYRTFSDICDNYNVREVWAYNCSFDVAALNYTLMICSNGWCERFIPATVQTKCIMGAALSTICNSKAFANSSERTEKGNIKVSAEMVYRYVSGNSKFVEDHTGLEDCKIELKILQACLKRRKKMDTVPKQVFQFQAWKDLQAKYPA